MAEDILVSILAQIGKEAFQKMKKNAKSIKINPKRILNNIEKRAGYSSLCSIVQEEFHPLELEETLNQKHKKNMRH